MVKEKIKIGIDIDGVLADLIPSLNNFYNRKKGTSFTLNDYKNANLETTWKCSKDFAINVVEEFFFSPDFLNISPIKGAQDAISILSEKYPLVAVTARPPVIADKTKSWISKYFGDNISEIYLNGDYTKHSSEWSKTEICNAKDINIFIEDTREIANKLSSAGIKTFLINTPGNQGELNEEVIRVQDWNEILNYFELK